MKQQYVEPPWRPAEKVVPPVNDDNKGDSSTPIPKTYFSHLNNEWR